MLIAVIKEQRKKRNLSLMGLTEVQRVLLTFRVLLVQEKKKKALKHCRAPQFCQPQPLLHGCHSSFKHADHSWPARLDVSPVHR